MENFHKLTLNYVLVPDYVIFEGDFTEKGWESFLAAGFFDANWQPT